MTLHVAHPPLFDERGFWLFEDPVLVEREHMTDNGLLGALIEFFGEDVSIIDFGCGTGAYVKGFLKAGLDARGYDGNPHTVKLSGGLCGVLDLSKPVDLGLRVDWVMSLEVGEHIPEDYESVFLDNLIRHCTRGVVLSWSTPELERGLGLGHVNCRPNAHVEEQMRVRGFVRCHSKEAVLRRASTCTHFPVTLMVYLRRLAG